MTSAEMLFPNEITVGGSGQTWVLGKAGHPSGGETSFQQAHLMSVWTGFQKVG